MLNPRQLESELDRDLRKGAQAKRQESRRADLPFLEWTQEYTQIRSKPFSLEGHAYLEELYRVVHPYIVFQKAAQVCISTRCLNESFYLADQRGSKVLYYLSTDNDSYDFSNDRINIAIDDSPYLQEQVDVRERGRDNVGLRHIGRGSIFCRGMFTRRKVKAVDGDMLVMDELDEADQANKRFAMDRILHSDLQFVRELSQPSIPDYGISESFGLTDQRYWHMQCASCGEWACFELNLDERDGQMIPRHFLPVPERASWAAAGQKFYRACLHCEKPLDVSKGEWVALCPQVTQRRGYQVSQLYRQLPMVGYADPADWIMEQLTSARKTMDKARAVISIIGVPYAGDRAPITDAVLDNCEGEDGFHEKGHGCIMGIDQGDELHIVIGRPVGEDRVQVVHVEHTNEWRRIPYLIRLFNVRCGVGDAMPNKQSMKGIAWSTSIPFYIQYFAGATLQEGEEGEGARTVRKVTVDRTESLDETTDALKSCDIILPKMQRLTGDSLRVYELFRAQCKTLVKDLVEDAKGVMRWEYKKRVPNHFGMALNSMRIASDIRRGVRVDYGQLDTSGVKRSAATVDEVTDDPNSWRAPSSELTRATAGILNEFAY